MNGQSEEGEALLRRCVEQVKALHEEGSPEYRAYLPMHFEVLAEALQKKGDLDGARQLLHKSIGLRSVSLRPGSTLLPQPARAGTASLHTALSITAACLAIVDACFLVCRVREPTQV